MTNKLFVGGLPYETTQADLLKLFGTAGKVFGVKLIMDRETGRSKGFAFIEMAAAADTKAAMEKLNGAALGGRKIFITEARPQEKAAGATGATPASPSKPFAAAPTFVERRSGQDRRRRPGFGSPARAEKPAGIERREGGLGGKKTGDVKPWADKKTPVDKKPWGKKKPWDYKSAGDRKPWRGKPGGGKSGGFVKRGGRRG